MVEKRERWKRRNRKNRKLGEWKGKQKNERINMKCKENFRNEREKEDMKGIAD